MARAQRKSKATKSSVPAVTTPMKRSLGTLEYVQIQCEGARLRIPALVPPKLPSNTSQ